MDAVTGGLLGAAIGAFINSGFTYLDKRKTAPEITESKMLDFWLEQVKKVEDKQEQEMNAVRQSFEKEKQKIEEKHNAETLATDLLHSSLNQELRELIKMRGNDQLTHQKQIYDLELKFEKDKNEFMKDLLGKFKDIFEKIEKKLPDVNTQGGGI